MKYGLFLGCKITTEQYNYEMSLRAVLNKLGVEVEDLPGAGCCGGPLKPMNMRTTLTLSARVLALAADIGSPLLVPCSWCHKTLAETEKVLSSDEALAEQINGFLSEEGLRYRPGVQLQNVLDLFITDIGLDKLKSAVANKLEGMTFAAHYGCHSIRPSSLGRMDSPEDPKKMETIIQALGASTKYYPELLNCCGAYVAPIDSNLSLTKTGQKLKAVQDRGFSGLVNICGWCQAQFDFQQEAAAKTVGAAIDLPVIYLTQLIGKALGISDEALGLHLNQSSVDKLEGTS